MMLLLVVSFAGVCCMRFRVFVGLFWRCPDPCGFHIFVFGCICRLFFLLFRVGDCSPFPIWSTWLFPRFAACNFAHIRLVCISVAVGVPGFVSHMPVWILLSRSVVVYVIFLGWFCSGIVWSLSFPKLVALF